MNYDQLIDKLIIELIKQKQITHKKFIEILNNSNFESSMEAVLSRGVPIYVLDSKIYLKTNNSFKDNELCFIDIETNGSKPSNSDIIEIAAIKYKNGVLIDRFQSYSYAKNIPLDIIKLTNIDYKNIVNAPNKKDVLLAFKNFIKDSTIVAHNLSFDFNFINAKLKQINIPVMKNRSICTLKLARKTIKTSKYGLENLNKILDINYPLRHRAYPDSLITLNVFHQIINKMHQNLTQNIELNLNSVEDLIEFIK